MPDLFPEPTIIRPATIKDLVYAKSLAQIYSNQLGFLPTPALEWYLEAGRVLMATKNDEPIGYVLGRTHLRFQKLMRPITQAAIEYHAQRRTHGLALVARIEADAVAAGQSVTQANCREGIEANDFWKAAGYTLICQMIPGSARGRLTNCWRKVVSGPTPDWFTTPPPVAGHRAKKTEIL